MAKVVSAEQAAIDALARLLGDPAPRVLHGSKAAAGVFKGASGGEKAAAKTCVERGWLVPTGQFAGKGKTSKELFRISPAGVQAVLARSDPSELLRGMQENLRQLGQDTQDVTQTIADKIKETLAPLSSLPGRLQALQSTIEQTLARIKLPDVQELGKLMGAGPSPEKTSAAEVPAASPTTSPTTIDWLDEVVALAAEQKQRNAFQRLTLPQVFERLRARHPGLTLGQYHDGLRRLQDEKRLRLGPFTQALATLDDPRNALFLDREVKYYVEPF